MKKNDGLWVVGWRKKLHRMGHIDGHGQPMPWALAYESLRQSGKDNPELFHLMIPLEDLKYYKGDDDEQGR